MTEAAKCLNGRNAGLNAVDCSRREMRGCTTDSYLSRQPAFPKTTAANDASPSTNRPTNDHSPFDRNANQLPTRNLASARSFALPLIHRSLVNRATLAVAAYHFSPKKFSSCFFRKRNSISSELRIDG